MIKIRMFILLTVIITVFKQGNAQFADSIKQDLYYNDEIFSGEYLDIYNSWFLTATSGGFSGKGIANPRFNRLEIMKYGIYQLFQNDTLVSIGKIEIQNKDDKGRILVSFIQDPKIDTIIVTDFVKYIDLSGDLLNLAAPCCDRINFHFKKSGLSHSILKFNQDKSDEFFSILIKNNSRTIYSTEKSQYFGVTLFNLEGKLLSSKVKIMAITDFINLQNGIYIVKKYK